MAVTGLRNAYGNVYESRYASSKKEVAEKQEAEQAAGKKYTNASEYYAYLKDKYPCLTAPNYKVTISPAYLEKCIRDPEKAEGLEKSLEHLPVSHQNMTASWKALGARVVNEQWIYDENGNCGFGSGMYVTNSNPSSGSNVQDKVSEKKGQRKNPSVQEHYEKRKLLREQFEEKQARKAQIREQIEESALSRERNTNRVIERYEASVLKA